jgi:hypothetical protein
MCPLEIHIAGGRGGVWTAAALQPPPPPPAPPYTHLLPPTLPWGLW